MDTYMYIVPVSANFDAHWASYRVSYTIVHYMYMYMYVTCTSMSNYIIYLFTCSWGLEDYQDSLEGF